jgi:hypothetical protein
MRIMFVQTSPACPEQYEAFDGNGDQVGYLRLRHGRFRVDFPRHGGETIHEAHPQGDGAFDDDERGIYLQEAYTAIVRKLSRLDDNEQSWYVVEDDERDSYEMEAPERS